MGKDSDRLADLYERNDELEKAINKAGQGTTSVHKSGLMRELNQVIDEIERLEAKAESKAMP